MIQERLSVVVALDQVSDRFELAWLLLLNFSNFNRRLVLEDAFGILQRAEDVRGVALVRIHEGLLDVIMDWGLLLAPPRGLSTPIDQKVKYGNLPPRLRDWRAKGVSFLSVFLLSFSNVAFLCVHSRCVYYRLVTFCVL